MAIIKHQGICNNHADHGLKNTTGNPIFSSVLGRRFLQPLSEVAFDWAEVPILLLDSQDKIR